MEGCLEQINTGKALTQCELTRVELDETHRLVNWIPNQFAIVGTTLRLKTNGQWVGEWVVTAKYATKPAYQVSDLYHDHKAFRYYEAKNDKR